MGSWKWGSLIIFSVTLAGVQPAWGRITHSKPSPSESWDPVLPLVIGGGFEFETDSEKSQYDFPLLIEYNFSEYFKLSIEPNFSYIDSKAADVRTVGGIGDIETTLEWEFLKERRYRPAVTATAGVRWQTASDPDLGNPGTDFIVGLILSKDFVWFDLDLNLIHTFSGDPGQQNNLEISLSTEIPLTHRISIIGEIVAAVGTGSAFGQPEFFDGEPNGGDVNIEGTLGVAWRVTKYLKLEQGITYRDDGTWQIVFAWEYSFAGED